MKAIINAIKLLIKESDIGTLSVVLSMLFLMMFLYKIKDITAFIKLIFEWIKARKVDKHLDDVAKTEHLNQEKFLTAEERLIKLKNHPVITGCLRWSQYELENITSKYNIDKFKYKSVCKTELEWKKRLWNVKVLLRSKLITFHMDLKQMVDDFAEAYLADDHKELAKFDQFDIWFKGMQAAIKHYEAIAKGQGVSEEFLIMFHTKHTATINSTMDTIEAILNMGFYDDQIETFNSCLSVYHFALLRTLIDLHEILCMNGQLTKIMNNWDPPEHSKIAIIPVV